MVAHAECVRNDGQRRIHRATGREETGIHNIEIIQLVCLAIPVERAGVWIITEPDCAVLVRDARKRDALA